ncbi:MAG: hypothetical protein GY818_16570, partial [Planctomycetaceae bacterium]|nr:hypothetical protein [Planctomycetaceae bacterium]
NEYLGADSATKNQQAEALLLHQYPDTGKVIPNTESLTYPARIEVPSCSGPNRPTEDPTQESRLDFLEKTLDSTRRLVEVNELSHLAELDKLQQLSETRTKTLEEQLNSKTQALQEGFSRDTAALNRNFNLENAKLSRELEQQHVRATDLSRRLVEISNREAAAASVAPVAPPSAASPIDHNSIAVTPRLPVPRITETRTATFANPSPTAPAPSIPPTPNPNPTIGTPSSNVDSSSGFTNDQLHQLLGEVLQTRIPGASGPSSGNDSFRVSGAKGPLVAPTIFEGDGLELFDDWFPQFEDYSKEHNLGKRSEQTEVMALTNQLSRKIQKVIRGLPGTIRNDYKALVEWLRARHGGEETMRVSKRIFKSRQREPREKIGEYVDLLRSYYARGYPNADATMAEDQIYDRIWRGQTMRLQNQLTIATAGNTDPKTRTPDHLIRVIQNLEELAMISDDSRPSYKPKPVGDDSTEEGAKAAPNGDTKPEGWVPRDPKTSNCYNCGQMGHFRRDCPLPQNEARILTMKLLDKTNTCQLCSSPTHRASQCPSLESSSATETGLNL